MKTGHGITAKHLEKLCEDGAFKPLGRRVLLEAVLEQEAIETTLDLPEFDHRTAIAWVIRGLGDDCQFGLVLGALVVNTSISGERIGSKASRWMTVHEEDLTVTVRGMTL
jgi:hypothetical protein